MKFFQSMQKTSKVVQSMKFLLTNLRSNLMDSVHNLFNVKHSKEPVKKLKMFQSIKRSWKILHFNGKPSAHPFDRQHVNRTIRDSLTVILHCVYLFHGAKSIKEYINSIYMSTAAISIFLSTLNSIYKSEQVYRFFDKFEDFINASKF